VRFAGSAVPAARVGARSTQSDLGGSHYRAAGGDLTAIPGRWSASV